MMNFVLKMRKTGKLISYNPIQIPRIDIMEHYDTIFTEMNVRGVGSVRLVAACE